MAVDHYTAKKWPARLKPEKTPCPRARSCARNRRHCTLLPWGKGRQAYERRSSFFSLRPTGIGVYDETFFSFPSGHATIAVACYGFIAYFLIRQTGTWRSRFNLSFAAIMLIAAIGFSRLYLGVHFLSDVLGGYLLGLLWLIIGICMTELVPLGKSDAPVLFRSPLALRISSVLLLLCGMAFYIYSGLRYRPEEQAPPEQIVQQITVPDILTGFTDNKLPRFTESITGETRKPLNVVFLADSDKAIVRAMRKAGWQAADPVDLSSVAKSVKTLLHDGSYPSAPVSPAFWNGRANEMGFEKAIPPARKEQHL